MRIVGILALALVLGLAPFIAGLLITPMLDWRLRAVPQIILCVALAGLFVWILASDRARHSLKSTGWLGSHPRLANTLVGVVAGVLVLVILGSIGDWFVPSRQLTVEITGWHTGWWRGAHLNIHTTEGQLETPMLWIPTIEAGPARLTLGGVSGAVLLIEQRPP